MTNEVEYLAGKENIADVFSRTVPPALHAMVPSDSNIDYSHIAKLQRQNRQIKQLRRGEGASSTFCKLTQVPLAEHGISLLCDSSYHRLRPIIPSKLMFDIFHLYHSWSHPGANTGIKSTGARFVWCNMRKDIQRWTKECHACARAKIRCLDEASLATITPLPSGRFSDVFVNITGPLGESDGYNYLLMVIDRFSRCMNGIPLKGITAEECVKAFVEHWEAWFSLNTSVQSEELSVQHPCGWACCAIIWAHNFITPLLTTP